MVPAERNARTMIRDGFYHKSFPLNEPQRVRLRIGPYWETFAPKIGGIVQFRGDLPYYLGILLESDPCMVSFRPHFSVSAQINGRMTETVYTAWAKSRDGEEYCFQALYASKVLNGSTAKLQESQSQLATVLGRRYAVTTDRLMLASPYLVANWSLILRFLQMLQGRIDAKLGERVVRCIATLGPMTLGEVESHFREANAEMRRGAIFRALHAGQINAEMSASPLSVGTIFRLPHG